MEQAEYTQSPATEKGRATRERIIASATTLFHARGYHATGIDDIGEAAGITGPGVYRHFAGKDEILMAVFDRMWMMLKEGLDAAHGLEAHEALEELVARHVDFAVDHRAETALLYRELRNLPLDYQARARRNRSLYEESWAVHIDRIRPDLDHEEAKLVAQSVFWSINSYAAEPGPPAVPRDRARELLLAIARSVITGSDTMERLPV